MNNTCSMTLLNSLGDITIVWDKDKDAEVKQMIRDKLARGIRFFVLAKAPILPIYKKKFLKDTAELQGRQVTISDAELGRLVASGTVELAKVGQDTMEFVKATRDVEEISRSNTVAMPQMVGG